jgi:phage shock protein C
MQTAQPSLFARDHTILGVCEGLGEDFGFNPIWLRVPLAVLLLVNPAAVVATYLGLGLLVLVTRWIAPNPRSAAEARPAAAAEPAPAANELAEDLAVAA